MNNSIRDQLLGLGYKPAEKPEAKPAAPPASRRGDDRGGKPGARPARKPDDRSRGKPSAGTDRRPSPRTREEIDLGKAYALRAQKEKDDRIEAERLKQEDARVRREAKSQLTALVAARWLNDPAAEIARHFEYGGKIKRVHVTPDQLKALNAGELGVAQVDGRYLLLPLALLLEAEAIFAPAIALKVDPNAAPGDDPYSDPAYQVPDDLVW